MSISTKDFLKLPRAAEALGLSGPAPVKEARRGVMNGWEASFCAEHLEPWKRSGQIQGFRFEAMTVTLYDGSTDVRKSRFTPDFMTWGGGDDVIEFYEVKGQRRRETMEKLKGAAQQYPMFRFYLATGGPARWEWVCL